MKLENENIAAQKINAQKDVTVLVLDDEDAILASLKSLFRKFKADFNYFNSSKKAMLFLQTFQVDIIISDLRMPDVNGLEFIKDSIKLSPNSIHIVMSGFEDKEIIMKALSSGLIEHFIYKPWEDNEYKELLAKCIELSLTAKQKDKEDILTDFKNIPSPPHSLDSLQKLLSNSDVSSAKVSEEIEKNPALVARLLRVANSVHIGAMNRINNIREAVMFVGLDYVTSMITALETFSAYSSLVPERYAGLIEALSLIAVRRAIIAKEISANWKDLKNPYVPYISSLLKDVGIIARISLKPELYEEYLKIREQAELSPTEVEKKVFGRYSHEEVGEAILNRWFLPTEIVKTVRNQHLNPAPDDYTKIVQLAMLLEGSPDEFPYDITLIKALPEWQEKLRFILTV